jgi:hypothetical protein
MQWRSRAVREVGIGEVRHQPNARHLRTALQPLVHGRGGSGCHAETIESGVDLEEHRHRWATGCFEPTHLFLMMHYQGQAEARRQAHIGRLEGAFDHQDRARPTRLPQRDRTIEFEQSQSVRLPEAGHGREQAVAVGIGLDHAPDPGPRRSLPDLPQIVCQRVDRRGSGSVSTHR